MQDLEKLGALDWAQEALQLSDEEVRRLVAMADTVAEDLSRGHQPNFAWEPAQRSEYQPPDKNGEHISYSRQVLNPSPTAERIQNPISAGGNGNSPEPMTRRQYVFTLSEAEVVDRVLGEQAAKRLYELCMEVEKHDW
jgi:hypothetical protein